MTHTRRTILISGLSALALATTGCPGGDELPARKKPAANPKKAATKATTTPTAEKPEAPAKPAKPAPVPTKTATPSAPKTEKTPAEAPKAKKPKLHSKWGRLENGHPVLYIFDQRDRLVGIMGKGYERFFQYDERDLLREHKHCDGRVTMFAYDRSRRLVRRIEPAGTVEFERDDAGRLLRLITPAGRVWSFTHAGDKVVTEDGASGLIRHDYDAKGRTKRVRDASGRTQLFNQGKDANGSWVDITTSMGESIQQRFDGKGKLVSIATEGHILRYKRSKGSFTIQSPQATLKIMQRDGNETLTSPWGTFQRIRNANERTVRITAPGKATFGFQLDDRARRVAITYPNGTTATLKRDFMRRLIGVQHPAFQYSAEYDKRHEQTRRVEHGVETLIGRDQVGRIAKVSRVGRVVRAFGYDGDGNRVLDVRNGVKRTATFDKRFRITRYGKDTFEHDAAGRLTKRVHADGTDTFRYDGFGRLVEVARAGSPVVRYGYSGQNRIVRRTVGKQTTHFVWEGSKLLAEIGPDKRVRLYVDGDDMSAPIAYVENGKITYLHADDRGTVLGYSDHRGVLVAKAVYGLFGESISVPTDRPLFYGSHWVDPIARVVPMRARVYEPTLGRFLTPDPSGLNGGFNPYVYAGNDPVDHVDPQGLKSVPTDAIVARMGSELEEKDQAALVEELARRAQAIADARRRGEKPPEWALKKGPLERLHDLKQGLLDNKLVEKADELKKLVDAAPIDGRLKDAIGSALGAAKTSKEVADAAKDIRRAFFPTDAERRAPGNLMDRFVSFMKVFKRVTDKIPVVGKLLGVSADAVEAMQGSVKKLVAEKQKRENFVKNLRKYISSQDAIDTLEEEAGEAAKKLVLLDPTKVIKKHYRDKLTVYGETPMVKARRALDAVKKKAEQQDVIERRGIERRALNGTLDVDDHALDASIHAENARSLSKHIREKLGKKVQRTMQNYDTMANVMQPLIQDPSRLLSKNGYDFRAREREGRKGAKRIPAPDTSVKPAPSLDEFKAFARKAKAKAKKRASWKVGKRSRGARGALEGF